MDKIEVGDIVAVNFHAQGFTMTRRAEVVNTPLEGELLPVWVIKDLETTNKSVSVISEPCTVTLLEKAK